MIRLIYQPYSGYNIRMSKKIFTYPSFTAAADAAVESIRKRTVDLDVRHILITPDKYTLYFETRLFSGGGAFDAEVLTFNRLFTKTVRGDAYLSKQGAVMLIRSIVENTPLTCFGKSAKYKGFAEKMYDTVSQLRAAGADILRASAEGSLGMKLADVAAIYRQYLEATAGKYTDAAGRMELLRRNADSDFVRSAYFYVVNFNGMTGQAENLIDALAAHAKGVSVFACAPERKRVPAEVYEADDEIGEFKSAARRIRKLAYEGVRYGDMCVVYAGDARQLKRVFGEYDIPFFYDNAVSLIDHPLARFVEKALDCAYRGFRRKDMLSLVKNMYSGATRVEADAFENYCNARLVDYLGFFSPFSEARAERAREKLSALLKPFASALRKADGERFGQAVEALVTAARAAADPAWKEAAADDTAAEKLLGVLRMAVSLMRRCRTKTVAESFLEGLRATDLSALPNLSDTVTIGPPEVFRGQRFARVFILGAADGELPAYTADGGIITDAEVERLKLAGIRADPTAAEINARAAEELRQTAYAAGTLYVSYPAGKRLSGVLGAILSERRFTGETLERESLYWLPPSERAAATADFCCAEAAAAELFITGRLETAASIHDALPCPERYVSPVRPLGRIDPSVFGEKKRLGVSEIESWFLCPLRHFFSYGLRLKPRDKGELSSLDIGTFLHETVERFVGDESGRPVKEIVSEIVRTLAADNAKYRIEQNAALFGRVCREAETVCGIVRAQLERGSFRSVYREAAFSSAADAPLRPIVLDAGGETVELYGKIDRVDKSGPFVRVIDYKTGSLAFSYAGVYYGAKLQLPIYMRAALAEGVPAGMFYFPFKTRWSADEYGNLLDGPFNADEAAIVAMDKGFLAEGKYKSTVIKASGERKDGLKLNKRDTALDADGLRAICDYAVRAAEVAVAEMREGYIAPSPLVLEGRSACTFCDYAPYCGASAGRTAGKAGRKEVIGDAVQ